MRRALFGGPEHRYGRDRRAPVSPGPPTPKALRGPSGQSLNRVQHQGQLSQWSNCFGKRREHAFSWTWSSCGGRVCVCVCVTVPPREPSKSPDGYLRTNADTAFVVLRELFDNILWRVFFHQDGGICFRIMIQVGVLTAVSVTLGLSNKD